MDPSAWISRLAGLHALFALAEFIRGDSMETIIWHLLLKRIWLFNSNNLVGFWVRYFLLDHRLHLVSEIKNSQDSTPGRQAEKCRSLLQLNFLLPGSPASPTKRAGPQKQPSMFFSLSEAAFGQVQGQVDRAWERNLPCSSHLQLSTSTEGRPWQSSRWCLDQMAGTAWQSTHAGRSSVPEAVCSTWRQIKPVWCTATTVNMPGHERQRGRSPTKPLLGFCSGSWC